MNERDAIFKWIINANDALGLIYIEQGLPRDTSLEFDVKIIKITRDPLEKEKTVHYSIGNKTICFLQLREQDVNRSLIVCDNYELKNILLTGTVLLEKDNYVTELRKKIREFPIYNRRYKAAVEFSRLIRVYFEGKKLYDKGHFLDAFNLISNCLHYLAKISVIQHGIYPEATVWGQVKKVEPEIYKLFEELTTGEEPIEKRIELILIAISFAISSKLKVAATHLTDVMKKSNAYWSIEDLQNHGELSEFGQDLINLIEFLVRKGVIDIVRVEDKVEEIFYRYYYYK